MSGTWTCGAKENSHETGAGGSDPGPCRSLFNCCSLDGGSGRLIKGAGGEAYPRTLRVGTFRRIQMFLT